MQDLRLNINLSFQQLLEVVKQLSPDERLKLNEAMWEEEMDIPDEHKKLVLGRIEQAKDDAAKMVDWNSAQKGLKVD